MKRFTTLLLLLTTSVLLSGQDIKTVTITYGMNKTLPPSYTFKADFTGEPARISWDFGDKSFSDEVSPTHLFPVSGVYIVQVKLLDAQGTVYYGKLEDKFEGKEPVNSPGIISGKGKVKDLSAIAGCRLAIVLENGTTLLPVEILPEFILKEGQMVTFAYELLDAATACQAGKAVKIHRISLVEETPPVLYGKGSVIDKSAVAGCGLLIVLDDGRVLIPVEVIPNFLLKEGQRVELVWEPLRVATTCMTGVPVRILKIAEITATGACKAYFTATNGLWSDPSMMKKMAFSNQSAGEISECFWSFGDGTTSIEVRPVHEYKEFGDYKVCLTIITISGCKSEYCTMVKVADPLAGSQCPFDVVIKPKESTPGVFLFYAVARQEITGWTWNFGDGSTSNLQNPEHAWEKPGTYEVACTIVTNIGCTETRVVRFNVPAPALPVCPGAVNLLLFDPSASQNGCDGKAVVTLLDENGAEYGAVKYTWSNGNSGNTALALCRDKTYVVQAIIEGQCQKNTSFAFLSKPQWRVSAVGDKFNFSVVSPVNDVVYRWDFGDGKTAYGSSVDYSFSSDGVYKVTLTAISGNSTADASQEITAMKSTTPATIIGNRNFTLYPNPVKELLYIRHDGQISAELILEISDIKGQVVFQGKYTTGMEQLTALPVSHLPDGMYLLRMISDNQALPVRKFIKRN